MACDGAGGLVREALVVGRWWPDYGVYSAVADFDLDCDLGPSRCFVTLESQPP